MRSQERVMSAASASVTPAVSPRRRASTIAAWNSVPRPPVRQNLRDAAEIGADLQPQPLDDRRQDLRFRQPIEQEMEGLVLRDAGFGIGLVVGSGLALDEIGEKGKVARPDALGGERGCRSLDRQPRMAKVIEPLRPDHRHPGCAIGEGDQRIFGDQLADGLAHRLGAGPEKGRHVGDLDRLPRQQPAAHQHVAQAAIDLGLHRLAGNRGEPRARRCPLA